MTEKQPTSFACVTVGSASSWIFIWCQRHTRNLTKEPTHASENANCIVHTLNTTFWIRIYDFFSKVLNEEKWTEGLPIDWVKVFCPPWQKIGHFGDVLPSQSLGVVPKKLNLTQQKQTTQEQSSLSLTETHKMLNLNKLTKTNDDKDDNNNN